ncbi:MAG: hypothetical protein JSS02_14720 [Planctomycetes bacterium]|nr:hypothetical protein [Planctomycetota bacterium]
MRTSITITSGVALLLVGYFLGASQLLSPTSLFAQGAKAKPGDAGDTGLSDETKAKIKTAADALKAAWDALEAEGKLKESATKGVNAFTVLTGGGGTFDDLKSASGVDPETFAALYAGLASDKVAVDLSRDPEGKLTYKGRVIRLYPISAIRMSYARRADITGEELIPTVDDGTKKPAKKTDTEEEATEE